MKINKIFTIFFLLVFGYIISIFKETIFLKTDLSDINPSLLNLIFKIDMLSGFLYPLAFFTFFYILFNVTSYIIIEKKLKNLTDILTISMIPNFIFILLNFYYLTEMNSSDVKYINENNLAIIPFLSFETSSLISNYIVYVFPPLTVLYYLLFKEKLTILNSLLISILPIIIVLTTYTLLK